VNGIILICGLALVGFWLEGINGKHGLMDEFLTPAPLGLLGCVMAFFMERWAA
jgi:hypothetical protein